jgi:hypothetical protein
MSIFIVTDNNWEQFTVIEKIINKQFKNDNKKFVILMRDSKIDNKVRNHLMKKYFQIVQYSCSNCTPEIRIENILKRGPKVLIFTNDFKNSENAGILNLCENSEIYNNRGELIEWDLEKYGEIPKFVEKNGKKGKVSNKEYNIKLIETTKKIRKVYEQTKLGMELTKELNDSKKATVAATNSKKKKGASKGSLRKTKRKSYENLLTIE